MVSKSPFYFKKTFKNPKVKNVGFQDFIFGEILYTSHLISYFKLRFVSFVIINRKRCDTIRANDVYLHVIRMFLLGRNFVSSLICRAYTKSNKRNT